MVVIDHDEESRKMAAAAAAEVYEWVRTTTVAVPDSIALSLGIIIGRLGSLERKNNPLYRGERTYEQRTSESN